MRPVRGPEKVFLKLRCCEIIAWAVIALGWLCDRCSVSGGSCSYPAKPPHRDPSLGPKLWYREAVDAAAVALLVGLRRPPGRRRPRLGPVHLRDEGPDGRPRVLVDVVDLRDRRIVAVLDVPQDLVRHRWRAASGRRARAALSQTLSGRAQSALLRMSKLERCIYSTKQMHTKLNAKHTIQTMMGCSAEAALRGKG